jgi:competence protein ComEC
MKQKLVFAVICYMAGGALCLAWGMGLWVLMLQAVVAFTLLYAFLPRVRAYLLTALVFFCIGVSCFALYKADAETVQLYIGRWAKLEGRVEPVILDDCLLVDVDSLMVDGSDTGYRGKLMLYPGGDVGRVTAGAIVAAEGQLKVSPDPGYRNYCKGLGAEALFYSTPYHLEFKAAGPFSVKHYSHVAAAWVRERLGPGEVPPKYGEVMKGLLLGGREVGEETRQRFSAVGISHLLAVSGLHVGIICGVVVWLLRKLTLPARGRFFVICAFLIFFAFMVGLTPSVVRASVMMGVLLLAAVVNRKQDMLTSLFLAAFLLTVFKPYTIYSVSFQLSFLACLGIALYFPVFNRVLSFAGKYLSEAVSVTLASQVLVLPLLILYFESFAPVSVLANILVVPLAGAVLWLTVAYLLLYPLPVPLYYTIAWVNGIIIETMDYIIDIAERIPLGSISVESAGKPFFAAYYTAAAIMFLLLDYDVSGKGSAV